jgi:hypothetical protein
MTEVGLEQENILKLHANTLCKATPTPRAKRLHFRIVLGLVLLAIGTVILSPLRPGRMQKR